MKTKLFWKKGCLNSWQPKHGKIGSAFCQSLQLWWCLLGTIRGKGVAGLISMQEAKNCFSMDDIYE